MNYIFYIIDIDSFLVVIIGYVQSDSDWDIDINDFKLENSRVFLVLF